MGPGTSLVLALVGMIVLWSVHARGRVRPYRATYLTATVHLETQRNALSQALSNSSLCVASGTEVQPSDAPSLLRRVRAIEHREGEEYSFLRKHAERLSFAIQQSNAAHRALHELLRNPRFLPDLLISGPIESAPIEELEAPTTPIRGFT
jgi:hypothetical protein